MTAQAEAKVGRIPWSHPVRRDDVPETGLHLDLVADAATRAAVAGVAGVRALPHLAATFDVVRQGDGLKVTGEVTATVEQTCVVTLEPMTSEVREPIDLAYVPPRAGERDDEPADVDDVDPQAEDEPEALVNGVADLGAAATEFLLLAIDPYPRKPDAVFEAPKAEDPAGHPFAALAALKTPPDKR
jgi:Large ribosomal RNA subunit accumulation protein YceD